MISSSNILINPLKGQILLFIDKNQNFFFFSSILETNINIQKILTHQWFDLWVNISNNLHHFQIFGKQFS